MYSLQLVKIEWYLAITEEEGIRKCWYMSFSYVKMGAERGAFGVWCGWS